MGKRVKARHKTGWMHGEVIDYRDVQTFPALGMAMTGAGFPQVKVRFENDRVEWLPLNYVSRV